MTRQEKKVLINNAAVLKAALEQISENKLTQYKPQQDKDKDKSKEIDYAATNAVIVGIAKSALAVVESGD